MDGWQMVSALLEQWGFSKFFKLINNGNLLKSQYFYMFELTIISRRTSVPSGIKKTTCWQSGLFQNCARNTAQWRIVRERGSHYDWNARQFSAEINTEIMPQEFMIVRRIQIDCDIIFQILYLLWQLSASCISFHGRMLQVVLDKKYAFCVFCIV